MHIHIENNTKRENYTRYGKEIKKGNSEIIDVAKYFGIPENECKQRIEDLKKDSSLKIIEHRP